MSVDDLKTTLNRIANVWIFQKEKAPTTEYVHYQAYFELKTKSTLDKLKDEFTQRAHLETSRGSRVQNRQYCSKEESRVDGPWLSDPFPEGNDSRKSRNAFVEALKCQEDWSKIAEEFTDEAMRYSGARRLHAELHNRMLLAEDPFADDVISPWMKDILEGIEAHQGTPNTRMVTWICDLEGNAGKTRFAKYLIYKYPGQVFYNTGGRKADVAFDYQKQPLVVFDLPREKQEYFHYAVLEELKNGLLSSPKYESTTKIFKSPFVLVMANWAPDFTKLSADRWNFVQV